MAGYIGTTPVPQATQHRESFTATGGQTSFATVGYTPQFIDVYLNGVKLAPADFTATNGSDVVLASGATASDILEIVAYTPFEVANQTFTGTTTAANLTVTGAFTSQGIDDNADAVAITIDSSENVGIGTTSPDRVFHVSRSSASVISGKFESASTSGSQIVFKDADTTTNDLQVRIGSDANDLVQYAGGSERMRIDSSGDVSFSGSSGTVGTVKGNGTVTISDNHGSNNGGGLAFHYTGNSGYSQIYVKNNNTLVIDADSTAVGGSTNIEFNIDGSEAMRLDSSGNVLVGKTGIGLSAAGIDLRSTGLLQAIRDGGTVVELNRQTSDGIIIDFRKDNTVVGSIGSISGAVSYIVLDPRTNGSGIRGSTASILPTNNAGANLDATIELGSNSNRFKDLYLSGGVYLGGTGSANKLDDYEEGTWTPVLSGGTTTTYVEQTGTYTKVGRLVFIYCELKINSIGNGSQQIISGLPFSAGEESTLNVSKMQSAAASFYSIQVRTSGTNIYASLQNNLDGNISTNPNFITSGTQMQFSGVYYTT